MSIKYIPNSTEFVEHELEPAVDEDESGSVESDTEITASAVVDVAENPASVSDTALSATDAADYDECPWKTQDYQDEPVDYGDDVDNEFYDVSVGSD